MTCGNLIVGALAVLMPVLVHAQTPPDPSSQAKIRIGPLAMTPTLALTNAGVDTNVFNESNLENPKRDFTITVTPATDVWLRLGRSWLSATIKEDLVYYKKYRNQRSANNSYKAGLLLPLNRLTLTGGASYANTRERPGFEIDARSQRKEIGFDGSVEIRALSKTYVGVKGHRQKFDFDKAAVFLGSNLRFELNRVTTGAAVTVRHQLTPLTSFTLDVGRDQDRFEFSPLRDSDSTRIVGGLKFDPFALIKGSATFGYSDFRPLSPGLPGYKGSIAAVDLSYVALGSTKLGVQATRAVQYSYDINQPYYLQTGASASISQQIYGPFDVVGRIGTERLDYRDRAGVVVAVSNRTDRVRTYGGGVGYRLGKDLRIGLNIDQQKRTSDVESRQYNGLRYGTTVTYGF